MYSTKDLTNIILEIRKTNAKDSELLLKLLDIIEDLYKQDEWVIFPITKTYQCYFHKDSFK